MVKQSNDPNPLKRKEVAENVECTKDLLIALSKDRDGNVRLAAYKNPYCPESVLSEQISLKPSENGYSKDCFIASVLHPNAPMDLLHDYFSKFSKHSEFHSPDIEVELASLGHLTGEVRLELARYMRNAKALNALYIADSKNDRLANVLLRNEKTDDNTKVLICERNVIDHDIALDIALNCTYKLKSALLLNQQLSREVLILLSEKVSSMSQLDRLAFASREDLPEESYVHFEKLCKSYVLDRVYSDGTEPAGISDYVEDISHSRYAVLPYTLILNSKLPVASQLLYAGHRYETIAILLHNENLCDEAVVKIKKEIDKIKGEDRHKDYYKLYSNWIKNNKEKIAIHN